jgi:hypothetical protein
MAASVEASPPHVRDSSIWTRVQAPHALHSDVGRSQCRCPPCRFSMHVRLALRSRASAPTSPLCLRTLPCAQWPPGRCRAEPRRLCPHPPRFGLQSVRERPMPPLSRAPLTCDLLRSASLHLASWTSASDTGSAPRALHAQLALPMLAGRPASACRTCAPCSAARGASHRQAPPPSFHLALTQAAIGTLDTYCPSGRRSSKISVGIVYPRLPCFAVQWRASTAFLDVCPPT